MAVTQETQETPKMRCKSIKLDGSPCNGHGLPQFDGYCIGHAPADISRPWRVRGGKNSSTAARADKRLPERYQRAVTKLTEGIDAVAAGTLTPAALNAISRAATALTTVYQNADQEMELIRNEETQSAAAAIAGGHGDLAILKAAADITDQQNQYRAAYFIEQGLATLQPVTTPDGAERLEPTLTDAGRHRLGLQKLTSYTDDDINALEQVALGSRFNRDQARAAYDDIATRRADMKEALEQAKAGVAPAPVFDPLTNQKLDQVPAGIRPGRIHTPKPGETRSDTEILQEQLERVDEILSEFRDEYPDALGMLPP